jgi:hypothetical protein
MLSTNVPLAVGFSPLQILGGPLASPLGVLAVLVVLALVVLVGRFVLKVAWRLVVIGIIVVGTLYILSLLGFGLS